jgi:hypothetical protein
MIIVYSKTNPIIIQKVVVARKIIPMQENNSYCAKPGGDDLEFQCK